MTKPNEKRNVFMLLASNALPYASICIRTMLCNSVEPLRLRLIVDNEDERSAVRSAAEEISTGDGNLVEIVSKEEVQDAINERFPNLKGFLQLHEGHPCWRKITDPIALSQPDDEFIVVDPDLIFPNYFSFEPTPQSGVMMMWQRANCLFPPDAVRAAFETGARLANNVDIGVAQVRPASIDMEWLDWFVSRLKVDGYKSFMHIEAIVWSALAMQIGGEHLNPNAWKCWQRGHLKRLAIAFGLPGKWTLKLEHIDRVKCIHVSGMSKWWVKEALETGFIKETLQRRVDPTKGLPYHELSRAEFEREQKLKQFAGKLGYQKLTGS